MSRLLYRNALISLTDKCTDIASYLYTQSQMSGFRGRVEMLAQQISDGSSQTNKPHPSPHHTQAQPREKLFTMETAKEMANRMKAIAKCK